MAKPTMNQREICGHMYRELEVWKMTDNIHSKENHYDIEAEVDNRVYEHIVTPVQGEELKIAIRNIFDVTRSLDSTTAPSEKQLKVIDVMRRIVKGWRLSNDISSPTLSSDIAEELKPILEEEDCKLLSNSFLDLLNLIRTL